MSIYLGVLFLLQIIFFFFYKLSTTEISCICGDDEQFTYGSENPINNFVIQFCSITIKLIGKGKNYFRSLLNAIS